MYMYMSFVCMESLHRLSPERSGPRGTGARPGRPQLPRVA